MVQPCEPKADADLLSTYLVQRSDEAFVRIVDQYTPMVYQIALRVLDSPHDAEDVTQATFIVLMRKAGTLKRTTHLGGWLFRTAEWTARRHLQARARREKHERQVVRTPTEADPGSSLRTASPLVDRAIASLPEGQRDVLVLRYFLGMSERETAEAMGLKRSTVAVRHARALAKLRDRLCAKDGPALPTTVLMTWLAGLSARGAPLELVSSTKAVCLGKAAANAEVQRTVEGIMRNMRWHGFTPAAAMVVLLVGGSLLVLNAAASEPPTDEANNARVRRPRVEPTREVARGKQPARDKKVNRNSVAERTISVEEAETIKRAFTLQQSQLVKMEAEFEALAKANPEIQAARTTTKSARKAFLAMREKKALSDQKLSALRRGLERVEKDLMSAMQTGDRVKVAENKDVLMGMQVVYGRMLEGLARTDPGLAAARQKLERAEGVSRDLLKARVLELPKGKAQYALYTQMRKIADDYNDIIFRRVVVRADDGAMTARDEREPQEF